MACPIQAGENAGRVAELHREVAELRADAVGYVSAVEQLEHELRKARAELVVERDRVAQLEREFGAYGEERARADELEARLEELEEAERQRAERGEVAELEHLLATAYVPREVPWADVAAGMMTISAQGEAWMVVELNSEYRFVLQNGTTTFEKLPTPTETVRVLVPYVTDAQAEATLRAAGATEVS